MMLPTHVLAGLAVALPIVVAIPELGPAVIAGALFGSVAPDLDLYAGHRRTLHYPTGYAAAAVPASAGALLWPAPASVALAVAVVAAALHCRMDRYGGGLELRPWEAQSERAVYDHVRGEWHAPRRWVRYDGAPADLALAVVLALPSLAVLEWPLRSLVAAAVAVGAVYTLLRRRLAALAPVVFGYAPSPVAGYVPDRYREA